MFPYHRLLSLHQQRRLEEVHRLVLFRRYFAVSWEPLAGVVFLALVGMSRWVARGRWGVVSLFVEALGN